MQKNASKKWHDPNKSKEKRYGFDKGKRNMKTPLIDKKNALVYEDKHWKPLSKLDPAHIDRLMEGKSPATIMKENHVCDGVLHLSGSFVEKHKEEILNTIKKCNDLAQEKNVLDRVQSVEQSGPVALTVYTSKNQLAVRIGKKIAQSFKGGNLKIHWSRQDKPVELWWHKDLNK